MEVNYNFQENLMDEVPNLEDYGLSQHGFLPSELPIQKLPDPYYNEWENVITNLQELILSKRLREIVNKLPVLSTAGLVLDSEWRRAYSILCFIAHSYIWGYDTPSERLPPSIAIPLLHVSAYLEVPPVATYSALCLWNFKQLFTGEDIGDPENLATLITFTGSTEESWFYLISVAIEARGASSIPLMLQAIETARLNDIEKVAESLRKFAGILVELGRLLEKMHDRCDPHVFYHRIRPFLAGSKNMQDAGLANGIIYEDGSGSEEFRQFAGGSNAQSSLIQFFDIVLGIEHFPTGERKSDLTSLTKGGGLLPPPSQNFILEMREYMPGPHRRFLEKVSKVANIRQFINANRTNEELTHAYDACLKALSDFRSVHIKIVSRYIILKSRELKSTLSLKRSETHCLKKDVSTPTSLLLESYSAEKDLKGTGGTALIPFLKQVRDETLHCSVNTCVKRVMNCNSSHNRCEFC
ncbi:Indoleamine 2,3-dioxygenase [Erysiphe neolycopersici]|uniref:Indoleamine 2,3-dioxygenase n=1 Tax=Erysiphe neolycopersici TaxID=212602 RepID=A0A420I7Q4_9PEZI|nr:Indoleamine 2,3-dioxygenase [Erysiphe neolycopersici]